MGSGIVVLGVLMRVGMPGINGATTESVAQIVPQHREGDFESAG
jgi:hypothetical protein